MKKLKYIALGILGSGCLACAPLAVQEESSSLANARENQASSPQCEWEQANCELSVTVQEQSFRLYSKVGLVRMERFDTQTKSWRIETERATGEDLSLIHI